MKSSDQPLISIVIPVYNRERLICRALNSVQQQTHENWEAIVVDDGSADDTPRVVMELARSDERIRFIRQDRNGGAQRARNAGIRAAQGTWIGFLDSDDMFLPNSLELRLEALIRGNLSVVHSEFNYIEENGAVRPYGMPPIAGRVYQQLLAAPNPVFQTLLVAKEALAKIGYLDEAILAFQEWETVIRLARYYAFGFVGIPTFLYDSRHSDSMSKNGILGARGYEQILHKHFVAILFAGGPGSVASHYRTAATWFERGLDAAEVRRCNARARMWSRLDPMVIARKLRREFQQLTGQC